MAETRSAVPSQSPGTARRLGNYISIQGNDGEAVSGQGQAADFGRASVQHMEQHALTSLDPDGLAMAQHPPVDGERAVPNLEAMRSTLRERGLHRALASISEGAYHRCRGQKVHRHITAAAVGGLEFLQGQKDFAIIIAGVVFRFDVHRTHQPAVLSCTQVRPGADVGVIEAKSRRPRHKRNAAAAMGSDERRAFLRGSIHIGRNELPVPVQLFRPVGLVVNVDGHLLALFQAQQRAGKLAVVGGH